MSKQSNLVNTSQDITVDSSGNVGIGATSPSQKLQVSGNSLLQYQSGATNNTAPTTLTVSNSTTGAHAAGLGASLLFTHYNSSGGYNGPKISGVSNTDPFTSNLVFYRHNYAHSEAMRIDSSGNLLVGTTNKTPSINGVEGIALSAGSYGGRLEACRNNGAAVSFGRLSSDGDIMDFKKDGTTVGSIGANSNRIYVSNGSGSGGLKFYNGGIHPCNTTGNAADNSQDCGNPSARFDDIYATNGTIQTSDRNEKQDIDVLSDAEQRVAVACKGLLRKFRWKDAVAEKGDDARIHFGIIAQDLQDAFAAEGLDAGRYAMFISNTWWETQTEVPAVEAVAEVLDEDGNVVTEAVEAKEAYTRTDTYETQEEAPAGATERTRLGVRYPELLAFIIGAM